jgi:hypothetical protein
MTPVRAVEKLAARVHAYLSARIGPVKSAR